MAMCVCHTEWVWNGAKTWTQHWLLQGLLSTYQTVDSVNTYHLYYCLVETWCMQDNGNEHLLNELCHGFPLAGSSAVMMDCMWFMWFWCVMFTNIYNYLGLLLPLIAHCAISQCFFAVNLPLSSILVPHFLSQLSLPFTYSISCSIVLPPFFTSINCTNKSDINTVHARKCMYI